MFIILVGLAIMRLSWWKVELASHVSHECSCLMTLSDGGRNTGSAGAVASGLEIGDA